MENTEKNKDPQFNITLESYHNFNDFQKINWERCIALFKAEDKPNLYWVTALAEELGEIAGPIKKLERGFNPSELKKMKENWKKFTPSEEPIPTDEEFKQLWLTKLEKKLGDELADLVTYATLCASANNINLWDAIKNKFNLITTEMQNHE